MDVEAEDEAGDKEDGDGSLCDDPGASNSAESQAARHHRPFSILNDNVRAHSLAVYSCFSAESLRAFVH